MASTKTGDLMKRKSNAEQPGLTSENANNSASPPLNPAVSKLLPSSSLLSSNPRGSDSKSKLTRAMSIKHGDALTHPPSLSLHESGGAVNREVTSANSTIALTGNNEEMHLDNVFNTPQKKTLQNIKIKRYDSVFIRFHVSRILFLIYSHCLYQFS
jgi:hypothetical protein